MIVESSSTETGYLAGLEVGETPPPAQPADDKPAAEAPSAPAPKGEDSAESPATDATKVAKAAPETLLDRVKAAVADKPAQEKPTDSKASQEKPADAPADADKAKDGKDGEQLPFHNHPRWKEVIAERDSYKEKAQSFDQFIGSVAQTGLNVGEFNELLSVGALFKSDPEKALERINAVAEQLRAIVGDKLPDALQQRVADGEISEVDARELSRAQARTQRHEQHAQQSVEQQAQDRAMRHEAACKLAGNTWESQQSVSDPDWSKKQPLVMDAAAAIIRERGFPPTVEDAVGLLNAAKKRVEARINGFVPAKARVAAPIKAGVASTSTAPVPKSLNEAIKGALALTRG